MKRFCFVFICLLCALACAAACAENESEARAALMKAYANGTKLDSNEEAALMNQWLAEDREDWLVNYLATQWMIRQITSAGGSVEDAFEGSRVFREKFEEVFPEESAYACRADGLMVYATEEENAMACYYASAYLKYGAPEQSRFFLRKALGLLYPRAFFQTAFEEYEERLYPEARSLVEDVSDLDDPGFFSGTLPLMMEYAAQLPEDTHWEKLLQAGMRRMEGFVLAANHALYSGDPEGAIAIVDALEDELFGGPDAGIDRDALYARWHFPLKSSSHYRYTDDGVMLLDYGTLETPLETRLLCQYYRAEAYRQLGDAEGVRAALVNYLNTINWWKKQISGEMALQDQQEPDMLFWRSAGLGAAMYRIALDTGNEGLAKRWYGLDGSWNDLYDRASSWLFGSLLRG